MGFFERILGGFAMGHHGGGRYGGGHHGRREYRDNGNFCDYSRRRPVEAMQAATCGKCGGANVTGVRFCEQCGAPMGTGTCEGCHSELTPGAKFCSQCGRPREWARSEPDERYSIQS
jgi:hypothetical protein